MAGISVLCAVRDSEMVRRLVMEWDDGENWLFTVVGSGTDALRVAQRIVPDILAVDAVLPGMDGPALVEHLRITLGSRMPSVIGGAMMPFAQEVFLRRGVTRIVPVPWQRRCLELALEEAKREMKTTVDWNNIKHSCTYAAELMERLGMRKTLRGFTYLSLAAALAASRESRLDAIAESIYIPIAENQNTTAQNVERLIRHAVESTMDNVGAKEIYAFFGNTIDPTRGKPTNAQMIALLAQRVRTAESREYGLNK